jgi:hypothetical protein
MSASAESFLHANPFALSSITSACEQSSIVASRDIVDEAGAQLWARDLRITPDLHQRLIERKLRAPLETSLDVQDGVDAPAVAADLEALVAEPNEPLRGLLEPFAKHLLVDARQLHLHAVVRLLLTVARQVRPATYRHAVRAAALAGALAQQVQAPTGFAPRAMLAGLVHDLGEIYVNPDYLDARRQLDLTEYRQLAAHPQVGAMLLAELTDYPGELVRAVLEHHERMDGTGYPGQTLGSALSPMGQLLGVVELVLGIADARPAAPARAAFALKFMPGEWSGFWAGPITRWAATQPPPWCDTPLACPDPAAELAPLDGELEQLLATAEAVAQSLHDAPRRVAERAIHRLKRLRVAWNAMGLWSVPATLSEPGECFDVDLALGELRYRAGMIGRDCLWPETEQAVMGDARLVPLWTALQRAAARTPRY